MIINITEISGALNKLGEETVGTKNPPGVMFNIDKDKLSVCYSDGHYAFIQKIDVNGEPNDIQGKIAVPYDQIVRAITNCQPSGSIVVTEVEFSFSERILKVSATQKLEIGRDENSEPEYKNMAKKEMDVPFVIVDETTDQKAKLLNRMNYESIFDAVHTDEWNKKELVTMLNDVSSEKGKSVYISSKIQKMYVVNTAYTCSVPVGKKFEITPEQEVELVNELRANGKTDDECREAVANFGNRITYGAILNTNSAKMLANILNKMHDETVYIHVKDGYMNVFNEDETTGIYLETIKGSKMHTGTFERFSSLPYSKFQLTLLREFLADSIKSAVNSTKSEKTTFSFTNSKSEIGKYDLIINASSSAASVSDQYSIVIDGVDGEVEELLNTTITVPLKVFSEMLSHLKTPFIGLDLSKEDNGQTCLRLAEVDTDKVGKEWESCRKRLNLPLTPVLDQPLPPTPLEEKMKYRANTLNICQYILIQ